MNRDTETPVFDCTNCGACCRSFPIFASESDAQRAPKIYGHSRKLKEHLQTEGKVYQLYPIPFLAQCPFLKEDQLCSIYEDRPEVCRKFEPGCEQCIEARRRQGICAH